MLEAHIEGIGLLGPGLKSWAEGRRVLAGELPHDASPTELPVATSLPPSERRRASRATRLVLAIGLEAIDAVGGEPSTLATVFTSSAGDGYNCHEICAMLASDDRQLSPTRFHNSVHNAPAGYWSIASKSMAPSSVICAHDASFGAGLLEAMAQVAASGERCVLIAYDTDYPEPLRATRPISDSLGIALVLGPKRTIHALATISVGFSTGDAQRLASPSLEALRQSIPSARGLPLLAALATGAAGPVIVEYVDGRCLSVSVGPET